MTKALLYFSLAIASGTTITNIYTSIVDAASWGNDIPASIETARQYYRSHNPGDFFRIFSPLNQLLALACVIAFWRWGKNVRMMLLVALVLYVVAEGLTFVYFYPRNEIMFTMGAMDVKKVSAAWQEWNTMNWIRTLIAAAGVVCTSMALHRIYATRLK